MESNVSRMCPVAGAGPIFPSNKPRPQAASPRAEAAILGPTPDVWARHGVGRDDFLNTPWYIHKLWQTLHQNGVDADYVNGSVLQEATVEDEKLNYGPMSYRVLFVAEMQSIEPATAEAIRDFARAGGTVVFIGNTPKRSAGYHNAHRNDRRVTEAIDDALRLGGGQVQVVSSPEKDELLQWTRSVLDEFGVDPVVEISPADPKLFQVHHEKDGRDIFFFTNQSGQRTISFTAEFDTGNKTPWRWDPQTGERAVYPHRGARNNLEITLKPLESLLLVFEPNLTGEPAEQTQVTRERGRRIRGPWKLALKPVEGEPFTRNLEELVDLGSADDRDLRTFGGTVTYRTTFSLDRTRPMKLDLGEVHGVADVTVNGQPVGVRWWGEPLLDVTDELKEGENVLEVKVATVLFNLCRSMEDNPVATRWVNMSGRKEPVEAGLVGPVELYPVE